MAAQKVAAVPGTAKQGTDALDPPRGWAEASIWTERMVSALVNGVKGGKWFSLVVLDGSVRRRLRAILRKQEKRPGIGRCQADHQRWPNAFFATHGLFTLRLAYEHARHSR